MVMDINPKPNDPMIANIIGMNAPPFLTVGETVVAIATNDLGDNKGPTLSGTFSGTWVQHLNMTNILIGIGTAANQNSVSVGSQTDTSDHSIGIGDGARSDHYGIAIGGGDGAATGARASGIGSVAIGGSDDEDKKAAVPLAWLDTVEPGRGLATLEGGLNFRGHGVMDSNFVVVADVVATNVTATTFTGNGAGLTNVTASGLAMPTSSPPADPNTVRGWMNVTNGGRVFKVPLYQ